MSVSHRTLFAIACLVVLTGCGSRTVTPDIEVSPLTSPLATPDSSPSPAATPSPTPPITAAEDSGVVVGTMLVENAGTPMTGVELFLGAHIGATKNDPLYGMDPEAAPRTLTDDQGRFVFRDVQPGDYAIILWHPYKSSMVRDPATRAPLQVTVTAGEVQDVGTLTEPHPQS